MASIFFTVGILLTFAFPTLDWYSRSSNYPLGFALLLVLIKNVFHEMRLLIYAALFREGTLSMLSMLDATVYQVPKKISK